MFAESDAGGIEDLFDDDSGDSHKEPEQEKPAGMKAQRCSACGKEFRSKQTVKFCSDCGAPLGAAGAIGTVNVLLAEDAIITRRKVSAVLKRLGCIVIEATNGREAVGMAHQHNPHLIILDVHMPDLNGLEALDQLRKDESFKSTTIVMLTGEADAKVVRNALTRGANDYIRKDSSPTELQERINRHIQNIRAGT